MRKGEKVNEGERKLWGRGRGREVAAASCPPPACAGRSVHVLGLEGGKP